MLAVVAFIVFGLFAASLVLAGMAINMDSWRWMWGAAVLSLVFSLITGFSIGPLTFVVTVLQFASAIAMKWRVSRLRWTAFLLLGLVVWFVVVPLQLILDAAVIPWLLSFPLIGIIATAVLFGRDLRRNRTA